MLVARHYNVDAVATISDEAVIGWGCSVSCIGAETFMYVGAQSRQVKAKKDGNEFVAEYECKKTGEKFSMRSPVKAAVERGMQHLVGVWQGRVYAMQAFPNEAIRAAMAIVRPILEAEAKSEHDKELASVHAEERARDTLRLCLTNKQRRQFDKNEWFTVECDHESRKYPKGTFKITKGSAFNIMHVETQERFCVVAKDPVPVYDQMLTQKLLLENDPMKFFKTANRSGGPSPQDPIGWYQRRLAELEVRLARARIRDD